MARASKSFSRSPAFLILLVLASAPLRAEVYQWTDSEGTVHFGDQVPDQHRDSAREVPLRPSQPKPQEPDTADDQSQRIREAADALAKANREREDARAASRQRSPAPARSTQDTPYELPESPERSLNYHR